MRKILDSFEGLLAMVASVTRQPMSRFINIESSDDDETLVAKDGSLVSVLRIEGARTVIGPEELGQIVDNFKLCFNTFLEKPGHALQVHYARDPERSRAMVMRAMHSIRQNARRQDTDLEDLLSERERHLPARLAWEACHFVLWSRSGLLTREERKDERRRQKNAPMPPKVRVGQWPDKAKQNLHSRHTAFVRRMAEDLGKHGIRATLLTAHEALVAARECIYPDQIGSNWKPILPMDKIRPRLPTEEEALDGDHSCLFLPPIERQLLDRDAEVTSWSPATVRIGDNLFGCVDMTIAPEVPQPFSQLLSRISDTGMPIPWRCSILLEGGGLHAVAFNKALAGMLTWANTDNKRINNAMKALREFDLTGGSVCRLRMSFATWAPANEPLLLRQRVATLQSAVEGWGNAATSSLVGDPVEGWASSALLIDCASTAPSGAAPVEEALEMLPWQRPASPWDEDEASVLFRTRDGKMWGYRPGSTKQTSFLDLIFAPPGYGKSVLLNSINLAACLARQSSRDATLPRIAIIDVGPSSAGLISLIRESLPPHRRHEAMYERLRMTPEYAINPFDTQVGLRKPLPHERAFIINLLTLLCTPYGGTPHEGVDQMIGSVVDEVYRVYGDDTASGSPKPYSPRHDRVVDEKIREHNVKLPTDPSWWDVVDAFVEIGQFHIAGLAQRYAVPSLSDTLLAARQPAIADLYGTTKIQSTAETLTQAFQRTISSVVQNYPMLAGATRFDIGGARVCALDLDEVAPRGGEQADRQTAICYMLARHVLARDYFLNEDLEKSFPPAVRDYHMRRIKEIRESQKRLVYDEFHRANALAVRKQVLVDIREGRKWGIQIALASQLLDDFDTNMVDQATGVWICGTGGSDAAAEKAVKIFGLGATALDIIRRDLRGPTAAGAPFLAVLNTTEAKYVQLLYNSLGPIELWALSTTMEDAQIRNRLYRRIGPTAARQLLAEEFPKGSAKKLVERRLAALSDLNEDVFGQMDSVVDNIVEELVVKHGTMRTDRRVTALEQELARSRERITIAEDALGMEVGKDATARDLRLLRAELGRVKAQRDAAQAALVASRKGAGAGDPPQPKAA